MPLSQSPFQLPGHLAAKSEPALIAGDERHLAAVAAGLEAQRGELAARLDAARRAPGGTGRHALERDLEVHRLTARLQLLRRFGLDLCLGRMVAAGGAERVYVGRVGLSDADGRRLLVDWRSPAAEPFFGATHANPMGLLSRRRYRWTDGRITDYWDEVFTAAGLRGGPEAHAALDDQSAFIAGLGASRTRRMRDVLATIQADQDAVIRAGSRGTLVVDGGPGTGKTVVALHRAAYLLYADPRVGHEHGGVLFVGPHQPYLDYVADVLPGLGEEGVRTCTLRTLVPGGAAAVDERDPQVARLKSTAEMVAAIEAAVAFYEEPPTTATVVETEWDAVRLTKADWASAFESAPPGTAHNDARQVVWDELITIVIDKHVARDEETDTAQLRAALQRDRDLRAAFDRAWPLLEAADVVADLWSVPAYLRRCAPWLSRAEVSALQRDEQQAWTTADLPMLDAARRRLGDPRSAEQRRRKRAALAAQRQEFERVIDHLIAADDTEMQVMSMLRGPDLREALVDESVLADPETDPFAGPFAHVVVDEAQELTDAEWQMLLQRCPSGSFTVVGDRAQARHGFAESWQDRLTRVGLDRVALATLSINYRTPSEIMTEAEPVIRSVLPDANVPTSVRSSGLPVLREPATRLPTLVDGWLAATTDGLACVIGAPDYRPADPRVLSLTPQTAKGLEFDLVLLVEPAPTDMDMDTIEYAVDRYVAMTRATRQLVLLTRS